MVFTWLRGFWRTSGADEAGIAEPDFLVLCHYYEGLEDEAPAGVATPAAKASLSASSFRRQRQRGAMDRRRSALQAGQTDIRPETMSAHGNAEECGLGVSSFAAAPHDLLLASVASIHTTLAAHVETAELRLS